MDYNTYMFYLNNLLQHTNNNQSLLSQSVKNTKMYLKELEMTNEYQYYMTGIYVYPVQQQQLKPRKKCNKIKKHSVTLETIVE